MATLNQIGLDSKKSAQLGKGLNDLLANYHIFFQNLRGFHWNIKGQDFFTLHIKFEEIYTQSIEDIDLIAERIRTLGLTPIHAYSEYLKISEVKELKNHSNPQQTVRDTLNNFSILLVKERAIMKLADDAEDDGTSTLMSDFIRAQEKLVWMLSAWLNK